MGLFQDPLDGKSCWMCEHWQVEHPRPSTVTCVRKRSPSATPLPNTGCAFYVRATGSDDETDNAKPRAWR